jgi:hypothetical protein
MDDDTSVPEEFVEREERLEHVGYFADRVVWPDARLERILAFNWVQWHQERPSLFAGIASGSDEPDGPVTQRDARVAASVVQWLGTAVGYAFLSESLRKAGFKVEIPREGF